MSEILFTGFALFLSTVTTLFVIRVIINMHSPKAPHKERLNAKQAVKDRL